MSEIGKHVDLVNNLRTVQGQNIGIGSVHESLGNHKYPRFVAETVKRENLERLCSSIGKLFSVCAYTLALDMHGKCLQCSTQHALFVTPTGNRSRGS